MHGKALLWSRQQGGDQGADDEGRAGPRSWVVVGGVWASSDSDHGHGASPWPWRIQRKRHGDPSPGLAGLVVVWLKVEGVTALGLPVLSVLMLAMQLNEASCQ